MVNVIYINTTSNYEQITIEIQDSENKVVFTYTDVKYTVTYKANGENDSDLHQVIK